MQMSYLRHVLWIATDRAVNIAATEYSNESKMQTKGISDPLTAVHAQAECPHLQGNASALAKAGRHRVQSISYHCDTAMPKVLAGLQPPAMPARVSNIPAKELYHGICHRTIITAHDLGQHRQLKVNQMLRESPSYGT